MHRRDELGALNPALRVPTLVQYDHEPAIAVVRFWLAYSGRPEAFDRREELTKAGNRALAAMELQSSRPSMGRPRRSPAGAHPDR